MTEQQWYYGQVGHRSGPCSANQLRALAASGQISPLDFIWKEGTEQGALASRVKNLFPLSPSPVEPEAIPQAAEETVAATGPAATTRSYAPSGLGQEPERKMRAVALQGAKICSQDGNMVQYIKICATCKFEERSRTSMRIRHGVTRVRFFCPKCRKARPVEIHGKS